MRRVGSEFLPCDLATIYRCRWEVELLFRELKTRYELDEFDTTKKHIVEILVYAALLTLIVSRTLLDLVAEYADDDPQVAAAFDRADAALTAAAEAHDDYREAITDAVVALDEIARLEGREGVGDLAEMAESEEVAAAATELFEILSKVEEVCAANERRADRDE